MKRAACVCATVAACLLAAGCGIVGRNGEAAETSTPPLATVPAPTTIPLPPGGSGGAAPSSDPCEWVDDATLDELFDRRPPPARPVSAITHRQCDWRSSVDPTSLSVRVDSGDLYDVLARDPSIPSLTGTALPALVEELPGAVGRRVSVRLVDGTLQVTVERFGTSDDELVDLVDEILLSSGN